ncbi:hypothetical protein [Methanopyrus kandleri]
MVPVARRAIPTLVSLASLVVVLAVPVSGEEYALRDHGSGLTTVWFYDPNTMGSQLPSGWKDYLWADKPTSVALGFEFTGANYTSYFDSPFAHDIVGRLIDGKFDPTSVDYAEANGPVSSPDDLLNAANRSGTPLTLSTFSLKMTDGTSTYYLVPCYGGSDRVPYYLDEDSWPAKGERAVIWVPIGPDTKDVVPFLLRGADEPNAILVAERPGSERLDLDGDGNPDVDLSGLTVLRLKLPRVRAKSLYVLCLAVGGALEAVFHVAYADGSEQSVTRTLYDWTWGLAPKTPLILSAVTPCPDAPQEIPAQIYAVEVPLDPPRESELEGMYLEVKTPSPCMVWVLALTLKTTDGKYLLVQGPNLYYEMSPDEHLLNVASFRASDVEFPDDGTMKLKLHIGIEKCTSVSLEGVDLAFLDRDGTTLAVTPSEGELEGGLLNSLRSTGVWDSDEITLSHPNGDIAQHLPAIIILRVTGSTELTDNHGNTSQFTVMACPREVDVLPLSFECRISQTEWRQNGDEAIVRGTVTVDHLTSPGGSNTVHWIAVTRDWSGAEVVLGEGSTEFPGGLLVPCSVDFTTRGPAAILRTGFDVRVSVGYFERLGGTVGYETAPVILPLTPRVLTVDDVEVTKTVESDGTKELIVLIVTVRFTPPDGPFILDRVDVIVRDESGNIVGERTLDSPIPENDSITVDVPLDDDVSRASVEVTLAGRDGQGIRYQVTRYEKFVGDLSVGVLGTDLRVENGSLEGAVEVGIYVPTEGTLKVTCDGQPLPISIDGGAPSAQPQRLKEGAHRVSLVIPAGTHEISFEFTSPTDRVVKRYEWKIPVGFAEDPVVYQVGFDHGTGEATLYVSSRVGDGVLRIPYDGGVYERKFEYSRELVVNGRRVAELRSDVELVRVSVPEDPYGSLDVKLVLELDGVTVERELTVPYTRYSYTVGGYVIDVYPKVDDGFEVDVWRSEITGYAVRVPAGEGSPDVEGIGVRPPIEGTKTIENSARTILLYGDRMVLVLVPGQDGTILLMFDREHDDTLALDVDPSQGAVRKLRVEYRTRFPNLPHYTIVVLSDGTVILLNEDTWKADAYRLNEFDRLLNHRVVDNRVILLYRTRGGSTNVVVVRPSDIIYASKLEECDDVVVYRTPDGTVVTVVGDRITLPREEVVRVGAEGGTISVLEEGLLLGFDRDGEVIWASKIPDFGEYLDYSWSPVNPREVLLSYRDTSGHVRVISVDSVSGDVKLPKYTTTTFDGGNMAFVFDDGTVVTVLKNEGWVIRTYDLGGVPIHADKGVIVYRDRFGTLHVAILAGHECLRPVLETTGLAVFEWEGEFMAVRYDESGRILGLDCEVYRERTDGGAVVLLTGGEVVRLDISGRIEWVRTLPDFKGYLDHRGTLITYRDTSGRVRAVLATEGDVVEGLKSGETDETVEFTFPDGTSVVIGKDGRIRETHPGGTTQGGVSGRGEQGEQHGNLEGKGNREQGQRQGGPNQGGNQGSSGQSGQNQSNQGQGGQQQGNQQGQQGGEQNQRQGGQPEEHEQGEQGNQQGQRGPEQRGNQNRNQGNRNRQSGGEGGKRGSPVLIPPVIPPRRRVHTRHALSTISSGTPEPSRSGEHPAWQVR